MIGINDKILFIGGGHCKSSIDVIEQEGKYQIAGMVDVAAAAGADPALKWLLPQ